MDVNLRNYKPLDRAEVHDMMMKIVGKVKDITNVRTLF